MDSPCHWCTERKFMCHTVCPEYKEFKQKREEIIAVKAKANDTPELNRKTQRKIWKRMRWR